MDYISKTTPDGKTVKVKDYKKRLRKKRRRRRIFLAFLLLAAITAFALFAPVFDIKTVKYSGNFHVTEEELLTASTIGMGHNIFRTSTSAAEERILQKLPYVHQVQVRRKFPNIISISVEESTVAGYFQLADQYVYIDKYGKMLEQAAVPPQGQLPIIEGLEVENFEAGKQLSQENGLKTQGLVQLMEELDKQGLIGMVTVIQVPSSEDLRFIYNNMLEVYVGDTQELEYKIGFLFKNTLEKRGDNAKGYLDVSNTDIGAVYRENK